MVAESKGFQNRTGWALGGQNKQTTMKFHLVEPQTATILLKTESKHTLWLVPPDLSFLYSNLSCFKEETLRGKVEVFLFPKTTKGHI